MVCFVIKSYVERFCKCKKNGKVKDRNGSITVYLKKLFSLEG